MKEKQCSIRDIAQAANVSPATVSRVFAESGYVSQETKELVLAVAQERGYTPKHYQRRTAQNRGELLVGIVVADLHNPFFQKIIDAAEQVFAKHGVNIVICNSDESAQKEIRNLSMLRNRVDGVIISPVSEVAEYNRDFLHDLNTSGTPVVLIDRDLKGVGVDGVFQDNYSAAIECVETFIRLGHKHIATISGPISSKPGLDRLNGYMDALRTNGLPIRQEYIGYGDFKLESGYQLAKHLLSTQKEITALYCANNFMAIGALQAITESGRHMPDDLAFICNGSLDVYGARGAFSASGLSEYVEPIELMGEEAAMMMLEKLNGGKKRSRAARRISYEGYLKLRGSEVYPTAGK
ncbi:MAG: LacI family DNA-binding transcriptional regulator [Clostridia bacterium]|nr:LacI family DNA-binding transcriptional regulator [Clostridia bacterium]